ncbi:MAG: hypothetical protein M9904_18235 [Chitinophagaceae bacterium]|nr:hypothetical protein [Chitinophagaceae bacterium]
MKTYQLLRNNQMMGYYTKTCLLQIGLQPLDLLWIEGESITWKYPSELEELSAYVPQAELTSASVVNNRKEKQIRYFDTHIAEMDYKKVNIQYIEEPDAVSCDVAPGFEYVIMAQDYRLPVEELENETTADALAMQEAVDAVQAFLNQSPVSNDVPEMMIPGYKADSDQFTTIWDMNDSEEGSDRDTTLRRKRLQLAKIRLNTMIAGLITLASIALHLKM